MSEPCQQLILGQNKNTDSGKIRSKRLVKSFIWILCRNTLLTRPDCAWGFSWVVTH